MKAELVPPVAKQDVVLTLSSEDASILLKITRYNLSVPDCFNMVERHGSPSREQVKKLIDTIRETLEPVIGRF